MAKTTVIIPTINDPHLQRTIESIRDNATSSIEVIVINDGGSTNIRADAIIIGHVSTLGRRYSINKAANIAGGEYLFVVDSHCSMSKGWDVKMQESVNKNNLVYCVIRDMNPDTWEYLPGDYLHVYLNTEYTEKWWNIKTLSQCKAEEESMCFTGCAWMVTKNRFWQLGGYDETLGKYGWDGPEWSLKTWMNGGKVILRTDVICGHIFGTNDRNGLYRCEMIPKSKYIEYMKNKYSKRIQPLIERFKPVPGWDMKEKNMPIKEGTGRRQVTLRRQKEDVTRNDRGEVTEKVITYYEYVYTGELPEEEVIKKYSDKAKIVKTERWKLKDGQLQKIA